MDTKLCTVQAHQADWWLEAAGHIPSECPMVRLLAVTSLMSTLLTCHNIANRNTVVTSSQAASELSWLRIMKC